MLYNSNHSIHASFFAYHKWYQYLGLTILIASIGECVIAFLPITPLVPNDIRILLLVIIISIWRACNLLPPPVIAILPIIVATTFNIMPLELLLDNYATPTVYLFLGNLIIGSALKKGNIPTRFIIYMLKHSGHSPIRLLGSFMVTTAVISLILMNATATIIIAPIVLSIAKNSKDRMLHQYCTILLIAVAYSATIGGMASLTGSTSNAFVVSYIAQEYGITISFAHWLMFGIPISALLLLCAWGLFALVLQKQNIDIKNAIIILHETLSTDIGSLKIVEKLLIILLSLKMLLLTFSHYFIVLGLPVNDTITSLGIAMLIFFIPNNSYDGKFFMKWNDVDDDAFGALLNLGSAIALATLVRNSQFSHLIITVIDKTFINIIPFILIAILIIMSLTELVNNTTIIAICAPLMGTSAVALGYDNPLPFMILSAFAGGCAFITPIGTAANQIIYNYGTFSRKILLRYGIYMNSLTYIILLFTFIIYI